MDQILGQPWVDYDRGRLYVTSRHGSGAGGQNSIWIVDVINQGKLFFVTTDGYAWCIVSPGSTTKRWTEVKPNGGLERHALPAGRHERHHGQELRGRRLVALALALLALPLASVRPASATPDDDCTQQSRRVRLPNGFAEARLSFAGVLTSGRVRVGQQFPGGVRDVRLVVTWSDLERAHHQRLELYGPDGSLYPRFLATFTGGDHRPVSVVTALPVAGSSITDAGLYGDWCVEVFLDDEDAPIARRGFELTAP